MPASNRTTANTLNRISMSGGRSATPLLPEELGALRMVFLLQLKLELSDKILTRKAARGRVLKHASGEIAQPLAARVGVKRGARHVRDEGADAAPGFHKPGAFELGVNLCHRIGVDPQCHCQP